MTKYEIVQAIAQETGIHHAQVKGTIQHLLDLITDTIVEEGRIELRGFGVFELREVAARKAQNPRTGEKIDVPARLRVRFKPSKEMTRRIGSPSAAE